MHFVKINLRSGVFFSRADEVRGKKNKKRDNRERAWSWAMSRSIKCADHFETSTSPSGQNPHIWPSLAKGQWGIWPLLCVGWGIWAANVKLNLFLRFALGSAVEPIFGLLTFYIVLKHDALTDLLVSSETIHQPVGREGWENKYTETWAFTPREWWQLHDFSPVVLPGDGSLFRDLRLLFWDRQARM